MLIHRGRKHICLRSTSTLDAYIVGKHMGSMLYSACVAHKIYAYLMILNILATLTYVYLGSYAMHGVHQLLQCLSLVQDSCVMTYVCSFVSISLA